MNQFFHRNGRRLAGALLLLLSAFAAPPAWAADVGTVRASTAQSGGAPGGALDGDRFGLGRNTAWKGQPGQTSWWWRVQFEKPRRIGAILQIVADHRFVFTNAPRQYVWQTSQDGKQWEDLPETSVTNETRLYRLHRLRNSRLTAWVRLHVRSATGVYPSLREVEFYEEPQAAVPFPDWIVAVNTTHEATLPGHGREFIPLAQSVPGRSQMQAQQVWLDNFNEPFLALEPRPLCGFLSGNFKDWCEVNRELWRGAQAVLRAGRLPLWASCGGAQGLAILEEVGVDKPWDCPHCRDPRAPKVPIYTHIGHQDTASPLRCGDYSRCVFERGARFVRRTQADPVFAGMPEQFEVMESHCGQVGWAPAGWECIAEGGTNALTRVQCFRVKDRPIYAAQFHIEMTGTPASAERLMSNFLQQAASWGGYNPQIPPRQPAHSPIR